MNQNNIDKIYYNNRIYLTVIKDEKDSTLKDNFLSIFSGLKYFTIWILIIEYFLLVNIIPHTPKNIMNILFLQIIVSVCSSYIIHVHPEKQVIELYNRTVILEKRIMYIFDILFHHIPLLLMLYLYYTRIYLPPNINRKNIKLDLPIVIFISIVYSYINDPEKLYKLNYTIILLALAIALLFFRI